MEVEGEEPEEIEESGIKSILGEVKDIETSREEKKERFDELIKIKLTPFLKPSESIAYGSLNRTHEKNDKSMRHVSEKFKKFLERYPEIEFEIQTMLFHEALRCSRDMEENLRDWVEFILLKMKELTEEKRIDRTETINEKLEKGENVEKIASEVGVTARRVYQIKKKKKGKGELSVKTEKK